MSKVRFIGVSKRNRVLIIFSKWTFALLFWLSVFNVGFSIIYFQDWRRIERCNYCDDHSIWFRLIDYLRFIDFPRFYLVDHGKGQVEAQSVRWFIVIFLIGGICSALYFQNARKKLKVFQPKVDHSAQVAVTEELKVEKPQMRPPVDLPSLSAWTRNAQQSPLLAGKPTKAPTAQKKTAKARTAPDSNEIASRFGVKIWKTVSGNFQFVTAGSDRWLFKVDSSTDSAIETGIRSLGLPSFQGRCTWGSKHVSEGVYEPVLIAGFGNKDRTLVVILHWNDFWKHDAAVNALAAHFKVGVTPDIIFMPPIKLWDGKTGPQQMGYTFGFSINPSFGMMPLVNALKGIGAVGKRAVYKSHLNAAVGTIRIAQFLPDFFSSASEGGGFNK